MYKSANQHADGSILWQGLLYFNEKPGVIGIQQTNKQTNNQLCMHQGQAQSKDYKATNTLSNAEDIVPIGQCIYLPISSTRKFERRKFSEVARCATLKHIYDLQAKGNSIGGISKGECHAYINHNQHLRSFIELSTALKTMAQNYRLQRVDTHVNVLTNL